MNQPFSSRTAAPLCRHQHYIHFMLSLAFPPTLVYFHPFLSLFLFYLSLTPSYHTFINLPIYLLFLSVTFCIFSFIHLCRVYTFSLSLFPITRSLTHLHSSLCFSLLSSFPHIPPPLCFPLWISNISQLLPDCIIQCCLV